jgi:hypothetical protein
VRVASGANSAGHAGACDLSYSHTGQRRGLLVRRVEEDEVVGAGVPRGRTTKDVTGVTLDEHDAVHERKLTDLFTQEADHPRLQLDQCGPGRAAREGLDRERPGAGEQVEHRRADDLALQAIEDRLAHPRAGRTHPGDRRRQRPQHAAAQGPGADALHAAHDLPRAGMPCKVGDGGRWG